MSLFEFLLFTFRANLHYAGITVIVVAVTLTLMKREGMLVTKTVTGERLLRYCLFSAFMSGMVLVIVHIMIRYL